MDIFMIFILPAVIMLALALLIGLGLSYMDMKLTVVRDPKIEETLKLLSGANCGGCGYPGCSAYAQALAEGKADLSACNPTSKANKDSIAVLLGLASSGEETVAVVHCSGGNKCKDKYQYQGYGDCKSAQLLADGVKACAVGCMELGTCASSCKYNAISLKQTDGYAFVDHDKCTSCGACLSACPKKLLSRIPKSAKVYLACSNSCSGKDVAAICKAGCISCGKCEKSCNFDAVKLVAGLPVFDYTKCTACMACAKVCPRRVIFTK